MEWPLLLNFLHPPPTLVNIIDSSQESHLLRTMCMGYYVLCESSISYSFVYRDENLAKINKRISDYKVAVRNPPRTGKKLLVLDVDYTIFGMKLHEASYVLFKVRCIDRHVK